MQEREGLIAIYNVKGEEIALKKIDEIDESNEILKEFCVVLFNENNEVFMTKFKDGLWRDKLAGSCSGIVRAGENFEECALMAVRKELGFEAKLTFIEEKYHNFEGVRRFVGVFVGRANEKDIKLNKGYFVEGKWFDLESIKKKIDEGHSAPSFMVAIGALKII